MTSKWTKQEIEYIESQYVRGNADQIALSLCRSINAVRHIVCQYGFGYQQKQWTQENISYLREHYPNKDKPLVEMAKHLNTSIPALRTAAQRNGIFRKYVPEKNCTDCGCEISKWNHGSTRCRTCANKQRSGENHHNWKGGISTITDMIRRDLYDVWTYPIMKRDNFACQECGQVHNKHVHHVRPLKEIMDEVLGGHPELSIDNFDDKAKIVSMVIALHKLEDGYTICKPCHISLHYSANGVNCLGSRNISDDGNQQPSLGSNLLEGSTTSFRLLPGNAGESNEATSALDAASAAAL